MVTNNELDPLIGQYEHESHRPRADHAIFLLRKIASMVKPIMRRRNWRVGILAEFVPSDKGLLGLNTNYGEKINLRLRYAGDETQFLPLEEVVDTMLHELVHNDIGPHNEKFHALLDQLRDELEALTRKGYTGEGFLGRGDRVGGSRIPLHEAKRRARAAAETRRTLTAGSGQRLGGVGIFRGQDARSTIVDAIERRNRVEKGCASNTDTGRKIAHDETIKKEKVTTTKIDQEDQNEATMIQAYIDLLEEEEAARFGEGYTPPSAANPFGPRAARPELEKARSLMTEQQKIEQEILKQKQKDKQKQRMLQPPSNSNSTSTSTSRSNTIPKTPSNRQPEPQSEDLNTWTCEICTLVNPLNYLTCGACTVERPAIYSQTKSLPNNNIRPKPPTTITTSISNPSLSSSNAIKKQRLSSAQAHERFEREVMQKMSSRPVGWQCFHCGNWMETEWWTCASCGRMKNSS